MPADLPTTTMPRLSVFGVQIIISEEPEMRSLMKDAGGNPDDWASSIVFTSNSAKAYCSLPAWDKIRLAIDERGGANA